MARAVVCLVAMATICCCSAMAAPLETKNEATAAQQNLKPLVRSKRAELVMFGNHQNQEQRVKKSTLPVSAEEDAIDKKGAVKVASTIVQKEEVPDIINNGESSRSEENPADKTEDKEKEDTVITPDSETKTVTKVEQAKDGVVKETEASESVALPEADTVDVSGEDKETFVNKRDWGDDAYYYTDEDYYPYPGMYRRKRSTAQRKASRESRAVRSAPAKMMTAENMMSAGEKPDLSGSRVKRDLTTDDIRYWLENGRTLDRYPEYEEEDDYDDEVRGVSPEDLAQYSLPYGLEDSEGYVGDSSPYSQLEAEQEAEERDLEETKDRLAELRYLLEGREEQEEEEALEEVLSRLGAGGSYPQADVEESWQPMDSEPEGDMLQYEPIVYQGVAGIFIPLPSDPQPRKRQYMSMVPGVRKRDFYPASAEPDGGRWGAFVPQEDKRSSESYQRLYQMAQALAQDRERDWE